MCDRQFGHIKAIKYSFEHSSLRTGLIVLTHFALYLNIPNAQGFQNQELGNMTERQVVEPAQSREARAIIWAPDKARQNSHLCPLL